MSTTNLGYYTQNWGWINQASNGAAGVFEIGDDLNMNGYDIYNASSVLADNVEVQTTLTNCIQKTDGVDGVISSKSRISETRKYITKNTASVVITADELVDSIINFTFAGTITDITFPDYADVLALLNCYNSSGSSNNYNSFETKIINSSTDVMPDFTPGTSHTFSFGAESNLQVGQGRNLISLIYANTNSYNTIPNDDHFMNTNNLLTTPQNLSIGDNAGESYLDSNNVANNLNIGSSTTSDVNIGRSGKNVIIDGDNLKVDSIQPNGAGPVTIDGEGLLIYTPGANVEVHCGDISGAPPTNEALFHVEGKGDSGIIISAGEDGTGTPYFEQQGETRTIILNQKLDAGTNNAIIEASTKSTLAKNDIVFKTGGQFVTVPTLDDQAVPVGGVETLKLRGTDNKVEVTEELIISDSNGVRISQDGTALGSASSDICIGNNATSASGTLNIAIGSTASALNSASIAIGSSTVAGSNGDVAIGVSANATSSNNGVAIGGGSQCSGAQGIAIGASSNVSGVDGIAIGNTTTTSSTNSITIGSSTTNNFADNVIVGHSCATTGIETTLYGNENTITTPGTNNTLIGFDNTATGSNNIILGDNNTASNGGNICVGQGNTVSLADSLVIGNSSSAPTSDALVIGHGANASSTLSTVIGHGATSGTLNGATNNLVIGRNSNTTSGNQNSCVVGNTSGTGADVLRGTVLGCNSSINDGNDSTVVGRLSQASGGNNNTAVGSGTTATGDNITIIGQGNSVTNDNSMAIGYNNSTNTDNTIIIGNGKTLNVSNSLLIGDSNQEKLNIIDRLYVTSVASNNQCLSTVGINYAMSEPKTSSTTAGSNTLVARAFVNGSWLGTNLNQTIDLPSYTDVTNFLTSNDNDNWQTTNALTKHSTWFFTVIQPAPANTITLNPPASVSLFGSGTIASNRCNTYKCYLDDTSIIMILISISVV